ncbi:MAG: nitroreductase family protein [Candidatus Hadarchaeum sp.]|uniref:nitroreductase family protein n=1 Tax=Candidatus Hadarchaeum sp. TaxID=2883567 RepID=UPI00316FBA96
MDVFEAIKGRRSIRGFIPEPIKNADLDKILEAGIAAPSAGNCQPWEFVIVKDLKNKQKLVQAARGQSFLAEAPVVIVICADINRTASRYGDRGRNLYCIQDTAAVAQNIHLAAYALGYGTCWVGAFDEKAVAEAIKAPEGIRPLIMIPIGKPREKPKPTPRTPLKERIHLETF